MPFSADDLPPEVQSLAIDSPSDDNHDDDDGNGVIVPMTRMFRGTNLDVVNMTLFPNGTAIFSDIWDAQTANVYELGAIQNTNAFLWEVFLGRVVPSLSWQSITFHRLRNDTCVLCFLRRMLRGCAQDSNSSWRALRCRLRF